MNPVHLARFDASPADVLGLLTDHRYQAWSNMQVERLARGHAPHLIPVDEVGSMSSKDHYWLCVPSK